MCEYVLWIVIIVSSKIVENHTKVPWKDMNTITWSIEDSIGSSKWVVIFL